MCIYPIFLSYPVGVEWLVGLFNLVEPTGPGKSGESFFIWMSLWIDSPVKSGCFLGLGFLGDQLIL